MLTGVDKTMPFLEDALSSAKMKPHFESIFETTVTVNRTDLVRHKEGRRCLIEYDLSLYKNNQWEPLILLGKARAKGLDKRSFDLQRTLWASSFSAKSKDCISVPRPVACIAELNMWFQEKVEGMTLAHLLSLPASFHLTTHVADALHKFHKSDIEVSRSHTLEDELDLLSNRLEKVATMQPAWQNRLYKLLNSLENLAATIPQVSSKLIHRDFYQDQVLFAGSRVYLLDFDLAAMGDPALDIGNFLAHLGELGFRKGNKDCFAKGQRIFLETYLALGESDEEAIENYRLLSLARHLYISTLFPDRKGITEGILRYLEKKVT